MILFLMFGSSSGSSSGWRCGGVVVGTKSTVTAVQSCMSVQSGMSSGSLERPSREPTSSGPAGRFVRVLRRRRRSTRPDRPNGCLGPTRCGACGPLPRVSPQVVVRLQQCNYPFVNDPRDTPAQGSQNPGPGPPTTPCRLRTELHGWSRRWCGTAGSEPPRRPQSALPRRLLAAGERLAAAPHHHPHEASRYGGHPVGRKWTTM